MRLSQLRVSVAVAGLALLVSTTTVPVIAAPESLGTAYIKCWKPGPLESTRTIVKIVRKGVTRGAVGYIASSSGCMAWKLMAFIASTPPPCMGLRCGCDPEQARAMGFKPERGDCNL